MTIPCFARFRPGSVRGIPSDGQTPGESAPAVVAVGQDATFAFHPIATETLEPFGTADWPDVATWRLVIVPSWKVLEAPLFTTTEVSVDPSTPGVLNCSLRNTNTVPMGEALAGRAARRVCVEIAGYAQGQTDHPRVVYQFEIMVAGIMNSDAFVGPGSSTTARLEELDRKVAGAVSKEELANALDGVEVPAGGTLAQTRQGAANAIEALRGIGGGQ